MEKLLWIGGEDRCRALMRIYSGRMISCCIPRVSTEFLEKHSRDFFRRHTGT